MENSLKKDDSVKKSPSGWWSNTLSNIVGAVIGIVITFGIGIIVENNNRKNDRKITSMIIVENLIERADMLHNFFARAKKYEPRMKQLLKMTPEEISSMPEDSVLEYMMGFALHSTKSNELGRNIFNSELDILRSSDNYRFIIFVDDAFDKLDSMLEFYLTSGPVSLSAPLQDVLFEEVQKQKVESTTMSWELMQVVKSPLMRFHIQQYLENFCPYIDGQLAGLEKFKQNVYDISGISPEELSEFYDKYERNLQFKDR